MKYYSIIAKLGHQGCGKYQEITFYIKAKNAAEAYIKATKMPGVKHNNNSNISKLNEIDKEEYNKKRQHSAYEKFNGY